MKSWGRRSKKQYDTVHKDLQKVLDLALRRSRIDFSITEGHRSIERQQKLFKMGPHVTKVDGIKKKSKHNSMPSKAVDLMIYHANKKMRKLISWDMKHFAYLAGVIESCAQELFDKGEIKHLVRWGGNWDKDGVLLVDQSFDDGPHFEIYKP